MVLRQLHLVLEFFTARAVKRLVRCVLRQNVVVQRRFSLRRKVALVAFQRLLSLGDPVALLLVIPESSCCRVFQRTQVALHLLSLVVCRLVGVQAVLPLKPGAASSDLTLKVEVLFGVVLLFMFKQRVPRRKVSLAPLSGAGKPEARMMCGDMLIQASKRGAAEGAPRSWTDTSASRSRSGCGCRISCSCSGRFGTATRSGSHGGRRGRTLRRLCSRALRRRLGRRSCRFSLSLRRLRGRQRASTSGCLRVRWRGAALCFPGVRCPRDVLTDADLFINVLLSRVVDVNVRKLR